MAKAKITNKQRIVTEKGGLNVLSIAGISAGFAMLQSGDTWVDIGKGILCIAAGTVVHFYYQKLKENARWKK